MQMDINNIKSQINLLQKKVDKNKIMIIENNKRINQYVEREKNLDYIAKEKKIVRIYRREYLRLENKYQLIKDPQYKESLLIELNNLENEYNKLIEENSILRRSKKKMN
jgi:hypothetical protein